MKFLPLYKNKMWGGNKISTLGFDYSPLPNCGELWALSGLAGQESVVANGFLADNTLSEVLEVYMGELLGERHYARFGNEFPLLIKLIDAADRLSIQVHPSDELAHDLGLENGKTEMWYIIEADPGAELIDGFEGETSIGEVEQRVQEGTLEEVLHKERPQQGDVYFLPGGRVHGLGGGLLLAEIQQPSDITYRLYDYNRIDTNGQRRQLHVEEALDALDLASVRDARTHYDYRPNITTPLVSCPQFETSLVALEKPMRKDFSGLDSFVVYMCVEGVAAVKTMGTICPMHMGECVLVPAVADMVELYSEGPAKLLEVYINPDQWKEDDLVHRNDFDWVANFMGQDSDGDCNGEHHHLHDGGECEHHYHK